MLEKELENYARTNNYFNLAFIFACAIHLILGTWVVIIHTVDEVISTSTPSKNLQVRLVKQLPKYNIAKQLKPITNKTIISQNLTPDDQLPKTKPVSDNENDLTRIYDLDQLNEFIINEAREHTRQHPEAVTTFNQTFISISEPPEPATYIKELGEGLVDVKKQLFGRDICYFFDASDSSFGAIDFYPCKKKKFILKIP